jgi:hypothetical protein
VVLENKEPGVEEPLADLAQAVITEEGRKDIKADLSMEVFVLEVWEDGEPRLSLKAHDLRWQYHKRVGSTVLAESTESLEFVVGSYSLYALSNHPTSLVMSGDTSHPTLKKIIKSSRRPSMAKGEALETEAPFLKLTYTKCEREVIVQEEEGKREDRRRLRRIEGKVVVLIGGLEASLDRGVLLALVAFFLNFYQSISVYIPQLIHPISDDDPKISEEPSEDSLTEDVKEEALWDASLNLSKLHISLVRDIKATVRRDLVKGEITGVSIVGKFRNATVEALKVQFWWRMRKTELG